jgi:hypothetical protein
VTTICVGGGTSSSKPGFGETVVASAATFANMFLNSPSPWAAALAGAMAATAYDLTTFCASDPPALVVPTALEWAQFIGTSTPLVVGPIAPVIRDFFAYYAWFAFCKCDAGPAPIAAAASEPAATPQLNPPVPGQATAPCLSLGPFIHSVTSGQSFNRGGPSLNTVPASYVRVTTTTAVVVAPGPAIAYTHDFEDSSSGSIVAHTYSQPPGTVVTQIYAVPSIGVTTQLQTQIVASVTGGTTSEETLWEVFCNGAFPGAPIQPCCPPDPGLVSMISQIQQMVTLIQRQAAPFAYVYGANHMGLSGHGSFAVSGLLGVSVAPTTIPSSYGLEVGSPDEHFGLGFITLGTADGWTTSRPLDHDGTLMIPPSPGVFTSIGYTLAAGVVADIRELVREP